jgi:predicted nucleic acid-binding protein
VRKVFVDTSGFYAAIDKSDPFHARAIELFARAEREKWELVTTNYVVHESWALIQKRIGWAALDEFLDVLVPICAVEYVTMDLHAAGSERCRASRRRLEALPICRTKNGDFLTSEFRERESRRKNRLDSLLPVFLVIVHIPPQAADFQAPNASAGDYSNQSIRRSPRAALRSCGARAGRRAPTSRCARAARS